MIRRMKHGKPMATTTLNTLCELQSCRVEEYIPDETLKGGFHSMIMP